MEDDPFLIVKQQVSDALVNANTLYASWKRIQQTVSSPQNQELLWTADELTSSLEAIEQDLDDLEEAFAACQANPNQFNLTAAEMNNRRTFLTKSRKSIQTIRNTLSNPPKRSKSKGYASSPDTSNPYQSGRQEHNERFIEDEGTQQTMMMHEQDVHLDNMAGTLVNLRDIAGTMNREIDDQVVLLNDLGDDVERSEGKLKRAMRRVTTVLKQEEGKHYQQKKVNKKSINGC
ncbi:t-SNARE [Phycomyces blakesleeanus]|uniref:t-SNARE n=1 Tax=Phycomyces blakesleeanus TaxID=4837 RepID=A0ABR3AXU8_PHYBL